MALHVKKEQYFCRQTNHILIKQFELEIEQLNDRLTVLATVSAGCLHLPKQSQYASLCGCVVNPHSGNQAGSKRCWASAASENSCCEREAAPRSTHPALPLSR